METLNCKYCGAPITYGEERCPHCGRENAAAIQYAAEKKRYEARTAAVLEEVGRKNRRAKSLSRQGALLLAAVLTLMTMAALSGFLTDWADNYHYNKSVRNYQEVSSTVEALWEQGEYIRCAAYGEAKGIDSRTAGAFVDYHGMLRAAQVYIFVNDALSQYESGGTAAERNSALDNLCGLLVNFYDYDYMNQYVGQTARNEAYKKRFSEIYDAMDAILMERFALSREQVEQIRENQSIDRYGVMAILEGEG